MRVLAIVKVDRNPEAGTLPNEEMLAGFAVIQVNSKAEAVTLAKRFLEIAGEGESEVLQVPEM